MKHLKYFEKKIEDIRVEKTRAKFKKAMKPMSLEETTDFIINNCQEYLENPVDILRSIRSSENYFYSEPVRRYSIDNKNYYTLLMDNLPKWKNYPKRKNSFICSLSETHVFGVGYYVIPMDGSKWGVAPNFDIFHSFKKGLKENFKENRYPTIDTFFTRIESYSVKKFGLELSDTNYKLFRNQLKQLSNLIKDIDFKEEIGEEDYYHELYYMRNFLIEHNDKIIQAIIKIMDQVSNDFEFMTLSEIYGNIDEIREESNDEDYKTREIWTDSPCIFINNKDFEEVILSIEEKTGKKLPPRKKIKKR